MARAYLSGHTLVETGRHFGVSYAVVSKAVKSKSRTNVTSKACPPSAVGFFMTRFIKVCTP